MLRLPLLPLLLLTLLLVDEPQEPSPGVADDVARRAMIAVLEAALLAERPAGGA